MTAETPLDLITYHEERAQHLSDHSTRKGTCQIWTGSVNGSGYGNFWYKPLKEGLAHRVSWILTNGLIPDGMTIDHLCGERLCVRVAHMELVTRGENSRRGGGLQKISATRRAATECAHGHPFDADNTYWDSRGRRACRACRQLRSAEHYRLRKAGLL